MYNNCLQSIQLGGQMSSLNLDALHLTYLWCGPTIFIIKYRNISLNVLKETWLAVIIPKINLKELKRKVIVACTNIKTKDTRPYKDHDARKR